MAVEAVEVGGQTHTSVQTESRGGPAQAPHLLMVPCALTWNVYAFPVDAWMGEQLKGSPAIRIISFC